MWKLSLAFTVETRSIFTAEEKESGRVKRNVPLGTGKKRSSRTSMFYESLSCPWKITHNGLNTKGNWLAFISGKWPTHLESLNLVGFQVLLSLGSGALTDTIYSFSLSLFFISFWFCLPFSVSEDKKHIPTSQEIDVKTVRTGSIFFFFKSPRVHLAHLMEGCRMVPPGPCAHTRTNHWSSVYQPLGWARPRSFLGQLSWTTFWQPTGTPWGELGEGMPRRAVLLEERAATLGS